MESDGNAHGIFLLNSNAMGMFALNLFRIGCIHILGIGLELHVACRAMEARSGEYH